MPGTPATTPRRTINCTSCAVRADILWINAEPRTQLPYSNPLAIEWRLRCDCFKSTESGLPLRDFEFRITRCKTMGVRKPGLDLLQKLNACRSRFDPMPCDQKAQTLCTLQSYQTRWAIRRNDGLTSVRNKPNINRTHLRDKFHLELKS